MNRAFLRWTKSAITSLFMMGLCHLALMAQTQTIQSVQLRPANTVSATVTTKAAAVEK